jgi:hypothetical protein
MADPPGLFNNRRFLQYCFVLFLAIIAALAWLLDRAGRRAGEAARGLDLERKARPPRTLERMLAGQPPEVARGVRLSYLRQVWPSADAVQERRIGELDLLEARRGAEVLGLARPFVARIDCDACGDAVVEVMVAVGVDGRVAGVVPVQALEGDPGRAWDRAAFLARFAGAATAEEAESRGEPVSGATKTTSRVLEAVADTLRKLRR